MLTNYINVHEQDALPLHIKHDILSHVDVCLQNDGEYLKGLDEADITSYMASIYIFAIFYHNHGQYQDAKMMYKRALTWREKALAKNTRRP